MFDARAYLLGNNYERWIGQQLENDGYRVLYTGILFGSDDHGVDLVAIKGSVVKLIQCKWRKDGGLWPDSIKKVEESLIKAKELFGDLPQTIKLVAYTTWANPGYKSLAPKVEFIVRPISEEELSNYPFKFETQTSKGFEEYIRSECFGVSNHKKRHLLTVSVIGLLVAMAVVLLISTTPRKGKTVYIAPFSGQRYHYSKGCEGLESARTIDALTLEEAKDKGYTACGYCAD